MTTATSNADTTPPVAPLTKPERARILRETTDLFITALAPEARA